jgi:zinc/manganese transport system permease protein
VTDLDLLLTPLAAGALALLTHVPLGEQVLRRRIVFIDLAIAQWAALGALLAASLAVDTAIPLWLSGGVMALCGAVLVAWLARAWPSRREALIGLVYIGAAVLALLATRADPRGAQRVAAMLSGDVLWVGAVDLVPLAAATTGFVALHVARPQLWLRDAVFYAAFAILVSLSVPLLGVYLVFATLIAPALALADGRHGGWTRAVGWGLAGYAAGLLASLRWDLPSGPCIVLALMAACACGAAIDRAARRPARQRVGRR